MRAKKFILKDGRKLTIAEGKIADAQALIWFCNKISAETDFLSYGKGEFNYTLKKEKEYLRKARKGKYSIFLVAKIDGNVVGTCGLYGKERPRLIHIADFGISVLKDFWGLGIGSILMETIIGWARENGLRKLNLTVREGNVRAAHLYRKFGFKKEGTQKRGLRIKSRFYDLYYMGLEID
jgi:RimJ/RimL family protein N-acetyltransferase